jgi:CotH kinase protein
MPRIPRLLLPACALVAALAAAAPASARAERVATRLPLVIIDTKRPIADEPKVTARMRVVDRRGRRTNRPRHRPNAYRGWIGIEHRGNWSQAWPKKSFAVETRDRKGDDRDVRLLGLPEESDWVLHATYADRSLLRNVLAFDLARRMGRYAPRVRFVEVILDGRYHGVYVLMEPLEVGKRRLRAGEDGVLLELAIAEKFDPGDEWFAAPSGATLRFADPDPDDLSDDEKTRLRTQVAGFDAALHSAISSDPASGWRRWAHERSVVDFVLVQELMRNQDAFHASTYLHAARGGRLVFGPPWDFDLSLGNASHPPMTTPQGWITEGHPWILRLKDPALRQAMLARWEQLRAKGLRRWLQRSINRRARTLGGPARRNFARWRILGPNAVFEGQPARGSHGAEVRALKRWVDERIAWLDGALRD